MRWRWPTASPASSPSSDSRTTTVRPTGASSNSTMPGPCNPRWRASVNQPRRWHRHRQQRWIPSRTWRRPPGSTPTVAGHRGCAPTRRASWQRCGPTLPGRSPGSTRSMARRPSISLPMPFHHSGRRRPRLHRHRHHRHRHHRLAHPQRRRSPRASPDSPSHPPRPDQPRVREPRRPAHPEPPRSHLARRCHRRRRPPPEGPPEQLRHHDLVRVDPRLNACGAPSAGPTALRRPLYRHRRR